MFFGSLCRSPAPHHNGGRISCPTEPKPSLEASKIQATEALFVFLIYKIELLLLYIFNLSMFCVFAMIFYVPPIYQDSSLQVKSKQTKMNLENHIIYTIIARQ